MKAVIKTSVFTLISIILLIACNDEETPDRQNKYQYYKISESLYPMFFDIGSYWIYENVEKSVIDSIVVTSIQLNTLELGPTGPGQGPTGETEYYSIAYMSKLNGEYYEQFVGYIISKGCIYGGYLYLSSHHVGDSSLNAEITEVYDTLLVGQNTFFDVVKMEIQKDGYINSAMNLYYVDSIGVVKKEIKEGNFIIDTWNLARYYVSLYHVN